MGIKTRVNKKTNKIEYAWRYYFYNEEGKKVDTNTAYFSSKGKAESKDDLTQHIKIIEETT